MTVQELIQNLFNAEQKIAKLEAEKARLIEALGISNRHIQAWWKPCGELPPAKSYEIVERNDALLAEIKGK